MKKIFTLLLLLNSVTAFSHGGDKVGNGGDVIVCPDQRIELLDIFQGEEDWGFTPVNHSGDRSKIIHAILSDFGKIDSAIAKILLERSLEIHKELLLLEENSKYRSKLVKLTKNELLNISDEGVAELPFGCKIVQAATQIQSPFPREVKFTFQRGTWNSLEADVQAALILHEVIYEHMIRVGENSSRSTRYFNAALHAGAIGSVKDYFDLSSLFNFRNLYIIEDGSIRVYGPDRKCSIKRKWYNYSREVEPGGTTITVNRRYVIMEEENFNRAIEFFWHKYVSNGFCD